MTHAKLSNWQEFRTGWRRVVVGFLGMATGILVIPYSTVGYFVAPLSKEFGWSRGSISLAPSLLIAIVALSSPLIGSLADRYPSRTILIPSMLSVAACFAGLAQMNGSIINFLGLYAIMALLGAGTSAVLFSRIVSEHFQENRGLALGLALSGNGITAIVAPKLLIPIIEHQGWRAGFMNLAGLMLACAAFIWVLVRRDDSPIIRELQAVQPQGMNEAIRSSTFARMAAALGLAMLGVGGLMLHFVPFLTDSGLTTTAAAATASLIGVGLLGGRLLGGWLMDRLFAPRVGGTFFLLAGIGLAAVALGGADYAVLAGLSIGLVVGSELDIMGYLTARYFGMEVYGRVYGVLYLIVLMGIAISPVLYGYSRDATGSYLAAFLFGSLSLAAAAILMYSLPQYSVRESNGLS